MTLAQAGPNVVASGSGTLDLTGLLFSGSTSNFARMVPKDGIIHTGPAALTSDDFYSPIAGPASFGSGSITLASSGSGDAVGASGSLFVPSGYTSGSALSDISTYDNQTFTSLGVTPGTYIWTWGSGANADSFKLVIGVPKPSSLALLLLPLGLLGLLAARPRRAA